MGKEVFLTSSINFKLINRHEFSTDRYNKIRGIINEQIKGLFASLVEVLGGRDTEIVEKSKRRWIKWD